MSDLVKLYVCNINDVTDYSRLPLVNEEDRKKADKYKQDNDKKLHLLSAYLKRKYIKDYVINEKGKPISNNCFFNVSHSQDSIILGVSKNKEIGVDIEYYALKDNKDIANFVCSNDELNTIKSNEDFYLIWVLKESLLKCNSEGISNQMKEVPAYPIEKEKLYKGDSYFSKVIKNDDHVIAITLKSKEDFNIEVIKEKF